MARAVEYALPGAAAGTALADFDVALFAVDEGDDQDPGNTAIDDALREDRELLVVVGTREQKGSVAEAGLGA